MNLNRVSSVTKQKGGCLDEKTSLLWNSFIYSMEVGTYKRFTG